MKPIEVAGKKYLVHITHFNIGHKKYLEGLDTAIIHAFNTFQINLHQKYFFDDAIMTNEMDKLLFDSCVSTDLPWAEHFTQVCLLDAETKEIKAMGFSFCSPKEKNFNKKIGVKIALGRAVKLLETENVE